jgi:hypothetical protein
MDPVFREHLEKLLAAENASPPGLSEHYHQSRKQYTLIAGALLAYVLIGIDLPVDGKLIPTTAIALKNPDALPIIFITLLLYFGYRLTIEWKQCDARRCALAVSRVDFIVAHVLSCASIAAYLVDRALHVGLGELAVQYAPEFLFILFWVFLCIEAPLMLLASLDYFRRPHTGTDALGWMHRMDASLTPVFVILICVVIVGLNVVLSVDRIVDFSTGSHYYVVRDLVFGVLCVGAFLVPKGLRHRLIPAFLLGVIGRRPGTAA